MALTLMAIGWPEALLVLVIALLIFGANRLPQIGEGLGKAVRGLKRGLTTDDDIDVSPSEPKQVEAGNGEKAGVESKQKTEA